MTFDEVYSAILKILPNAALDTDNEGQLIVYTNLYNKGEDIWG
jgi:hypothetical protein